MVAVCLGFQAQHAAVVQAEPPAALPAEPVFPIVPIYMGVTAAGLIFAGVQLHRYGASAQNAAESLSGRIVSQGDAINVDAQETLTKDVQRMEAIADERQLAGTLCLVGGALALTTSVLVYLALEPEGGWTWSLTRDPTAEAWGLRVTRAF